jgi:hypothetical protein
VPVLTAGKEYQVDGPFNRPFTGCGGIRAVVPSPDSRWLLVVLRCFEDENTILVFQADGVRWGQAPGWSVSPAWIAGGRAVGHSMGGTMVELSPRIETYPTGEMRITHRVIDVRPDDVLNIRQWPSAEAPMVARIPPDGRGIVVVNEDGIEREGYFESTGWLQIVWGKKVGWVNGRYLRPVLGDREHEYSCLDDAADGANCGH